MGSKAGKILPLVALAGLGVATGGFGLAGGAAAGGAGAGVAAGSGAAAATGAGVAMAPAVLGGVSTGMVATPVASTGFFSGLTESLSALGMAEKAQLGLGALSAGTSLVGGAANASAQRAALAFQQQEADLAAKRDTLDAAQREADNQSRLARTLAALTVGSAAGGVAPSRALVGAAQGQADLESDVLRAGGYLTDAAARVRAGGLGVRSGLLGRAGAGAGVGTLLDFGGGALDLLDRRSRLGRA